MELVRRKCFILESEIRGAIMRNYLLALRRRLDYFDLLAVAALLLGNH